MRHIIFALVFLAVTATSAFAKLPELTFKLVQKSLVHVTTNLGYNPFTHLDRIAKCTGFVIGPHRVLTDEHCVLIDNLLRVDGKKVTIIYRDRIHDLAILDVETKKPALTFRTLPLMTNQELYSIGWGATDDDDHPITFAHTVLWQNYAPPDSHLPPGLWLRGPAMSGMSGGPIFDRLGRVVGILQDVNEGLTYGQPTKQLLSFITETK